MATSRWNPVTGTDSTLVRRKLDGLPIRVSAGIREVALVARRCVQEMAVPRWLTDTDGRAVPGALGIIADSVLGTAVMSTVPLAHGMVTTHLHLELPQPIPLGTPALRAEGRQVWLRDRFGVGEGVITTADGTLVGTASIGSLLLDGRARFGRPEPEEAASGSGPAPPDPHPLVAGSPVHESLGTDVLEADGVGVRVAVVAGPHLANAGGGVHGGVGVLMGERVLDLALRHALAGAREMRPVELRAAFLRPITADGRRIGCRATIAHLGRRLAAIRGEVLDHDGRPAVLVDATYVTD
jgi:uncharacterized protein (TIGR00369 family)